MDKMTTIPFRLYYEPEVKPAGQFRIHSLGLHERMPPQLLRFTTEGARILLMFFHTRAFFNSGEKDECECGKQFILWSPERIRSYGNAGEAWDHSWMVAEGPALERALAVHRLPMNHPVDANAETVFEHYLSCLLDELNSRQNQDEYVLEHLTDLFLYELGRLIRTSGRRIPEQIARAEAFMWKNLNRPLDLAEIAASVSLSVSRFTTLFREYHGESPMRFLTRKRMTLAAEMLNYHNTSCKQIAEATGYSDQLHFSRRFRQFWGISPTEYRKTSGNVKQKRFSSGSFR